MIKWLLQFAIRGAAFGLGILALGACVASYLIYQRMGMAGLQRMITFNAHDRDFLSMLVPMEFMSAYVLLALYEVSKRADVALKAWWHGRRRA